jgi:N utilization substance protein B|tara:strand:+ start:4247 stop:5188 length:942 start_codon:yes stop_codon:yes gene_type:complete
MLNRRQLRLKVMEVVYSYSNSIEKDVDFQLKYFLNSNKNFYRLYITILSIFKSIYIHSSNVNSKKPEKFLINDSDSFYLRISENLFLKKIHSDKLLINQIDMLQIDVFNKHPEYLYSLLNKIEKSELFSAYLKNNTFTFNEDKLLVLRIFKQIIALDNKLYDFYEDSEISWINDLPLVNSLVLVTLKKIEKLSRKSSLFTKIYKNDQDAEYGIKLIKKVFSNEDILKDEISLFTSNWDNERIAQIDLILLQMCLAEFLFFDSIPLKVSINEYLELAKEYSSPKSNIFINGIMDAISKKLIIDGRIKKNKRGLQ